MNDEGENLASEDESIRPLRLEPILESGRIRLDSEQLDLGEIVVEKEIGRGVNGVVYVAHDRLLERPVAVKVWLEKPRDHRDKKLQGLAEARKLASLQHPHVATMFHAGLLGGQIPYAILEYVPGVTLRERFTRPIELTERSRIWKQISSALGHAYGKGVYHGDLHPGNIMVDDRAVKVLDFGTSIFAPKHQFTKSREARLLKYLFLSVYPEYVSGVMECDSDVIRNKPEIVLVHTVSAANYSDREDILAKEIRQLGEQDYDLVSALGHAAHLIASAPFLSLRGILARLAHLGLSEFYAKVFLDRCQLFCEMNIRPNSGEGMYWKPNLDRTVVQMQSDTLSSLKACQDVHLNEYSANPKAYVLERLHN